MRLSAPVLGKKKPVLGHLHRKKERDVDHVEMIARCGGSAKCRLCRPTKRSGMAACASSAQRAKQFAGRDPERARQLHHR